MSACAAAAVETPPQVEPRTWKRAMGGFPSGVTILTTVADGAWSGTTVSAFSSLSLDPPLLVACLDRHSRTLAAIRKSGHFAVNILPAHQGGLAMSFASKEAGDRFGTASWRPGTLGAPVLADAVVVIECRLHDIVVAGDHVMLIGQGVALAIDDEAEPLVYRTGRLDWRIVGPVG